MKNIYEENKKGEIHPKDKEYLRTIIETLKQIEDKGLINLATIKKLTSIKSDIESLRDKLVDKVLNYYKQGTIVVEPDTDFIQD